MDANKVSVSMDRLRRFIDEKVASETGQYQQLHNDVDNLYIAYTQQRDNAQAGHELLGEYIVREVAEPPDRVRVEIKENAQGRPAISVRLTGDDTAQVTKDALAFYWSTKDQLDEGGIR